MPGKRDKAAHARHRRTVARAQPPCAICGEQIDYSLPWTDRRSFVLDHIVPIGKGGSDDLANKQPAHWDCNRSKSDHKIAPVIRRSGSLR